jgi:quercetin dioxygenase-like cupin family protein
VGVVHRFTGGSGIFSWDGVTSDPYRETGDKYVLIDPNEAAPNFALRYFDLQPGTTSTLDTHAHDHGVFVLHGHGQVLLGEVEQAIGFGDVVYVGPNEDHRFTASASESLGFLCVVPAKR